MSCEYVSRAWREFTGYTAEQALGDGWTRCLHPEDLTRWLEVSLRAFDERAPFEIEYRLARRPVNTAGCTSARRHGTAMKECSSASPAPASMCINATASCRAFEARLEGVRVLVVGEIAEARDALAKPLQGAGADVRVAANSAEALATLGAWHPDVMLSAKEDEPGTLLATVARLKA